MKHDLAIRRKGEIKYRSEIKGAIYDLKVSHLSVEIPSLKGVKFTMSIVCGYGKEPINGIEIKKGCLPVMNSVIE